MAHNSLENRINRTWLVLSGLTIIGWLLAFERPEHSLTASAVATIAVLVIAGVKSRLVLRQFMEVRTAPRWLRRTTDAGLIVVLGLLAFIYALA